MNGPSTCHGGVVGWPGPGTFYPVASAEFSIFQLLLPIEDHFSLASGSASAVSSDPRHRTTRVDEVTYLSEDTNGRCRIE
jgi:hypothetical protein